MGKSVCVPMGITWTCIGSSQWAIHGCAIWVVHWECPNGPSMALQWGSSCGLPWHSSLGSALGICPGASMDLHWGFSLGVPWKSSLGKSVGVPMGITWTCIGSAQWAIHGCAIWVVHWECPHPYGPFYGIALGQLMGGPMACFYG